MADFKYEIVEHIGTLSESAKVWTKELNRISWNGGEPKYDIRDRHSLEATVSKIK